MEELHSLGGVPPGWEFHFPDGDPSAGRAVFAKLECYQCHAIHGEVFPQTTASGGHVGPELTGMGQHHPVEYFADSILNPNAVIIAGPGYTDTEGLSIMPDYRGAMTLAEFVDLLAFLQNLKEGPSHHAEAAHSGHDDHGALLDQVVGDYHIRVLYHEGNAGHQSAGAGAHHGHRVDASQTASGNHLMAFIADGVSQEPVPYLPVSVTIVPAQQAPHTVQLKPMIGSQGFHYGADVSLPSQAAQLTLSIGPTSMSVMPPMAGRFLKPQQVRLDWVPQPPVSSDTQDHSLHHQHDGKESGAKGH
jgi:hypothetical protein